MTVRPGNVAEVRIRRRGGLQLNRRRRRRRREILRGLVPLLLPRHRAHVIQPLAVDLTGVLLLELLDRLEQTETRHRRLHLVAPGRRLHGRLRVVVRPRRHRLHHQLRLGVLRVDGRVHRGGGHRFRLDVHRGLALEHRRDHGRRLHAGSWQ